MGDMKIGIRSNLEIGIPVDTNRGEKKGDKTIVVADVEIAPIVRAGAGRRRD